MKLRRALIAMAAVGSILVGVEAAAPAANAAEKVHYKITVTTGQREGSGTNATVKVKLHGSAAASGWLLLDTPDWDDHEQYYANEYEFDLPNLGTIRSVDVYTDHAGERADWFVNDIEVTSPARRAFFEVQRWFTEAGTVTFTIPTDRAPRYYKISVLTGDLPDAGTNAMVEIKIRGDKGLSPWIYLGGWDDDLERGQLDSYLRELYDVGNIDRILLRFDHSGRGPDWFLDNISISTDFGKPAVGKFTRRGWLTQATTITMDNEL